mgnify:CR=1 FL=1
METLKLGPIEVSRFILGGNPMSGNSHQSSDVDRRMRDYFTTAQCKRLLRDAGSLGVNTFLSRCDRHMQRLLIEYQNEGGRVTWIAQTCPEFDTWQCSIDHAFYGGAKACYIHGGMMDHFLANDRLKEIPPVVEMIRNTGMAVGIAAHLPEVFDWAERETDVDFYMCSYHNPSRRDKSPMLKGFAETFSSEDRRRMVERIATLSRPAIHYKVLAAGRKPPEEAFEFVAKHLRPQDAVCVGIYDEDDPSMLSHDVSCFENSLARTRAGT